MKGTNAETININMPVWYRVIFLILLLWSLFWVYIYYITNSLSEKEISNMPAEGRELYLDIPTWILISGGIGIIASITGLILVQMRKRTALFFLGLAFLGILVRDGWFLVDGRVLDLISNLSLMLSSSLLISYLIQFLLALSGVKKGWLK